METVLMLLKQVGHTQWEFPSKVSLESNKMSYLKLYITYQHIIISPSVMGETELL